VIDSTAADGLAKRIDAAAERERLLLKRLDPKLYNLIAPAGDAAGAYKKEAAPATVLVTILVTELNDQTVEALKKAGLSVRTKMEKDKFVVGSVAVKDLEGVALVDGVKKIEPVEE
jgi:hypothetical protein